MRGLRCDIKIFFLVFVDTRTSQFQTKKRTKMSQWRMQMDTIPPMEPVQPMEPTEPTDTPTIQLKLQLQLPTEPKMELRTGRITNMRTAWPVQMRTKMKRTSYEGIRKIQVRNSSTTLVDVVNVLLQHLRRRVRTRLHCHTRDTNEFQI